MELGKFIQKIQEYIKKYKYAILVLLIGIAIMLLPVKKATQNNEVSSQVQMDTAEVSLEKQLSQILSEVEGVGEVRVLLTVAAGEEIVYQVDQDISKGNDDSNIKSDTVTVMDENRKQNGIVRQVNPATYQGAIVVCQGADNKNVQLAVVDAVSKATGLGLNRISVIKMR